MEVKNLTEPEQWKEWERLSTEMSDDDPRLYADNLDDHTREIAVAKSRIRMRACLNNAILSIQSATGMVKRYE